VSRCPTQTNGARRYAGIRCLVSRARVHYRSFRLLRLIRSVEVAHASRKRIEGYLRIRRSLCRYSVTFRILALAVGKSWDGTA